MNQSSRDVPGKTGQGQAWREKDREGVRGLAKAARNTALTMRRKRSAAGWLILGGSENGLPGWRNRSLSCRWETRKRRGTTPPFGNCRCRTLVGGRPDGTVSGGTPDARPQGLANRVFGEQPASRRA
ncbi:protein of unknown function [Kyrpidia spormannii]|uniref:Uncharacterized protein n=1 Tax=Kyrpidia spormannii TaxID=2055160 RepID=A0A6F9E3S2_9BACL|nr:protein of unknown function [Kyrpidia spormannii]